MRNYLVIITAFIFGALKAQPQQYRALVYDTDANESIPYANIRIHLSDTTLFYGVTALNGEFSVAIKDFPPNAQLTVYCLGYSLKTLNLSELVIKDKRDTLSLFPKQNTLNEVTVFPDGEISSKPKIFKTGTYKKKEDLFHCRGHGHRVAVLLMPKKKFKHAFLQRFGFKISEESEGKYPFRITFNKVSDHPDKSPGEKIGSVELVSESKPGGGWVYFDVSSYQVPFDKEGIYAVIEWLPTGDLIIDKMAYGLSKPHQKQHFCIAEHHCRYKDYLEWYQRPEDFKGWRRLKERPNFRVSNPLVMAEVEIIE